MYLGKVNLSCETQGNYTNSHFLPKTELPFQNHIEIGYSHRVGGRGFRGKTANSLRRHMEHIDEHRDRHLPDLSLYRRPHYTDCQSMVVKEVAYCTPRQNMVLTHLESTGMSSTTLAYGIVKTVRFLNLAC
jgi:hypothetical protein